MAQWQSALAVICIVVGLGVVVSKLTERPRIPDVAAFLVLGIILGPSVLHIVHTSSQSSVNQFIIYLGATLILFDGGRSVRFDVLRQVYISISLLVTVGVVVSACIVGVGVHLLLHQSWIWSLLLASILASTDPATLIPVFKRVPIVERLQQTMETESAFNDATASVLVLTLMSTVLTGSNLSIGPAVGTFFQQSLVGLAVGAVLGMVGLWLISPKAWGVLHDFSSIVMIVLAITSYVISAHLGASGFMAAFAAGVIVGNAESFGWELPERTAMHLDHAGNLMTTIMRILIFVFLGTQVDFTVVYHDLWIGLALVGILMFVARPLSVLSTVVEDRKARWQWREIVFMMWVRETGVIPAALASTAVADHVSGADIIMAVTFLAILGTILVQATTTGTVAKRLSLARESAEWDL
ncbi:cation:proton antiporter [Alicyclobacillus acidiphilus]|uniref:cation:proton antiporter n=1 Tax=Alicyclobacillus acidiphilus TaxID=182455 RepID=UPI001FE119F6|nr:cation:proton antiporter [Alicyclobacillus acidiphilus]